MSASVTCCTDGYPDHDVQMRWRGNGTRQAIYGIDDINIPQFTVLNIRTATAAGTASLGNALFLFPPSRRQRLKILLFPCFPPKAKRRTFITVILYIRNCAWKISYLTKNGRKPELNEGDICASRADLGGGQAGYALQDARYCAI